MLLRMHAVGGACQGERRHGGFVGSHTQARTLMQQLRLRLLTTPPRWHPSERPNLATVVAAGLAELGDVDTCDKILSDAPPERITYSNDSVHARVQL